MGIGLCAQAQDHGHAWQTKMQEVSAALPAAAQPPPLSVLVACTTRKKISYNPPRIVRQNLIPYQERKVQSKIAAAPSKQLVYLTMDLPCAK